MGDPGCNLADAASELFNAEWSRHYAATTGADVYVDYEDEHWDAFRDGFEAECRRRAEALGWDLTTSTVLKPPTEGAAADG